MMRGLGLCRVLLGSVAWSNEVQLEASPQGASVVRLTYADGQPFAFEAYELYVPGKDLPEQVGRTDTRGQLVFLPGAQMEWRLKAYSADGHGVDRVFTVMAGATAGGTPAMAELSRPLLLASGLGFVFGLFGILQLFLRKKSS